MGEGKTGEEECHRIPVLKQVLSAREQRITKLTGYKEMDGLCSINMYVLSIVLQCS